MYENFWLKQWLTACCFLVILMIFIGGLTRLTDSGLSIVEWKPVTGIIPPLNIQAWQIEFDKYQTSPQYQKINDNMTLSEFKFIFWLEFIHRLAGRITGLIYVLFLIFFYVKGKIKKNSILAHTIILILFVAQGFMGWYMVKSGLINQPYVSHFRLAIHLIMAFAIYNLLFYQLMKNSFDILIISSQINLLKLQRLFLVTITVTYLQVFFGGLVAGLDAGLVYNSFPLMGNSFIPNELFNILPSLSNPVFVQFIHRIGAYTICIITIILIINLLKVNHPKLTKVAYYIIFALLLQMAVGIIVILYSVPIIMALIHQLVAIFFLSCLLWGHFLVCLLK